VSDLKRAAPCRSQPRWRYPQTARCHIDTLRLDLEPWVIGKHHEYRVTIYVNDYNFLDLIREIELPFARREGSPKMAGQYVGLRPKWVFAPSQFFLYGWSRPRLPSNEVMLMQCSCGEPGCWPLMTEVMITDVSVRWHPFWQPHRKQSSRAGFWDYRAMRPFVFDRAQYEAQPSKMYRSPGDTLS